MSDPLREAELEEREEELSNDPFAEERMEHETEQGRIAFGGGQL